MSVHIGALIEKRRKEVGMSKSELARRLNVRAQSMTYMLNNNTINTGQLVRLGEILQHNFFQYYEPPPSAGEESVRIPAMPTISISIQVIDEKKQQKILQLLGISPNDLL